MSKASLVPTRRLWSPDAPLGLALRSSLSPSFTHANQGHHVRDQLLDLRVENGIREYTKEFNEVLQILQPDDVDRDTVIWLYVKGLPDDIRKWMDFSLGKRELSTQKAVQHLSITRRSALLVPMCTVHLN